MGWGQQNEFVVDREGNILVDYIGRFENLQADFEKICQRININAKLPHLKKSEHDDYHQYYSKKTAKVIEDVFREDIELFGYSF